MTSGDTVFDSKELARSCNIPLYRQLEQLIRSMAEDGSLVNGQMLPSELEMIEKYHVSRTTVRQALKELETDGLLRREQGKGTFLCDAKLEHPLFTASSFTNDILNKGSVPGSITLFNERILPSKQLNMVLHLSNNEAVFKLERIRTVDGEPVGIHSTHLVCKLSNGLDASMLQKDNISLYHILQTELGLHLGEAVETLEAALCDERQRQFLGLNKGAPVLKIERLVYLQTGEPFEFSQMVYRADRYKSVVKMHVSEPYC
ncbi:MAG: GntR family transcriptional regulator [Acinetobacter sp.]